MVFTYFWSIVFIFRKTEKAFPSSFERKKKKKKNQVEKYDTIFKNFIYFIRRRNGKLIFQENKNEGVIWFMIPKQT